MAKVQYVSKAWFEEYQELIDRKFDHASALADLWYADLQAEHQDWLDDLPDSLQTSMLAERLGANLRV